MEDWIETEDQLPKEGIEIDTKIDDYLGIRNVHTLKYSRGLWWFPDMSMYIYYTPTHWKEKSRCLTKQ